MKRTKRGHAVLRDGCSEFCDCQQDIPDDILANIILPSTSSSLDLDISEEMFNSQY